MVGRTRYSVKGNEAADDLARKGPATSLKAFLRTRRPNTPRRNNWQRRERWSKNFSEILTTRETKSASIWIETNCASKRAGWHCRLKDHLSKQGLEDSCSCRFGDGAKETPKHLLTDWYARIQERIRCLSDAGGMRWEAFHFQKKLLHWTSYKERMEPCSIWLP